MRRSIDTPHLPGTTLLKIAPLLFTDEIVETVVQPTIADLQSEVAAAGSDRRARLRAQCRGYLAFWSIVFAAPFAPGTATTQEVTMAPRLAIGRIALVSIAIALLVIVPALGIWLAVGIAAGALVAAVIHSWNKRHPSDVPTPDETPARSPQINFSSTEVEGNIGGLIFALGSVVIVSLALPWVVWFLVVATVAGCFLAWGLVTWHLRHPKAGLPESPIVLR